MNPESIQSFSEGFFLEISEIYYRFNQENQEIFKKFTDDITAAVEKMLNVATTLDMEGKNSENVGEGVKVLMSYANMMEERINCALDQSFLQQNQ